jgi:hypothetical protein
MMQETLHNKGMSKKNFKKVKELSVPWEQFCKKEFEEFKKKDPPSPIFVWNPTWMFEYEEERDKRWQKYIHDVGNAWWLQYGFKLIWPKNRKELLGVEKI